MECYSEHEIVPHVLDAPPPAILKVEWNDDVKCMLGNELTPTQVQKQPSVLEWETEEDALYTILFTDPDSPTRTDPNRVEVVHWLVFNIPGCDVSKGLVHAAYIESGPREGSGFHRYVYLVYKQSQPITPNDSYRPRSPERRKPWNTRKFVEEYGLGAPIAGNFYIAQFDNYVTQFRAEMMAAGSK
ncbi:protein D3 [Strongylocentrotus purpuratus]|uniref:Phosphatidylethanolamine-binding protein n=1 Tax=Strongylocentrotus purpuratus TaxID=7668 RepID=A0A7M7HEE1_STRPU|nr:protein D3 [Strongylocentrotus purpuratus]XP_011668157.1 protein D3 [Strongylocentrotus purpuratus]|eukprot:XP_011668156.1 PREDICTED: protein D3-like [Strongylocentrotus purpuratus]